MAEVTLLGAVTMALARAMEEDERVILFGEDVAANGGVFRATDGLFDRFGPKRVMDTPIAETLIAGMAVGMAAEGHRPVAEIQFLGFIYSCFDQIINHAARLRNRTRGRLTCPLVIRSPMGAGIHAPEHHSESIEAMFAHVPGLRVVIPSSPSLAYGLLLAAIRDPDPVIFLEPTRLYRVLREDVVDDGAAMPLDCCFVLREGTDLTLVSWAPALHETLAAAEILAEEGISAEVIDVATVKPLDAETIIQSVTKTGRCVIVHEAAQTAGFGGEIAAQLAQHALTSLLAPIERVTGFDTVVPLPKLEYQYMPTQQRILEAARRALAYS